MPESGRSDGIFPAKSDGPQSTHTGRSVPEDLIKHCVVAAGLALATVFASMILPAQEEVDDLRYFMFIEEPNAAAWQYLMENPADREQEVKAGMEAVGARS